MTWFHERWQEALKYRRDSQVSKEKQETEQQEHARVIYADLRAGGIKYTDPNNPPAKTGWRWGSFVLADPARQGAGSSDSLHGGIEGVVHGTEQSESSSVNRDYIIRGWFPEKYMLSLPAPVWDTLSGSAVVLALLHDTCLVDTLEPENLKRIFLDDNDETICLFLEFWDKLEDEHNPADAVARRWELVQEQIPSRPMVTEDADPETPEEQVETNPQYEFRCEGDVWHFAFESERGSHADQLGFTYIREVLSRPGELVSTMELQKCARDGPPERVTRPEDLGDRDDGDGVVSGLSSGGTDHVYDAKYREDLIQKRDDLRIRLETARSNGDLESRDELEDYLAEVEKRLEDAQLLAPALKRQPARPYTKRSKGPNSPSEKTPTFHDSPSTCKTT
ncbi:MAG: hypothetical protein ABIG44_00340 [Planctomycetota bacterium]